MIATKGRKPSAAGRRAAREAKRDSDANIVLVIPPAYGYAGHIQRFTTPGFARMTARHLVEAGTVVALIDRNTGECVEWEVR